MLISVQTIQTLMSFFIAASLESARKNAADSNYDTTEEERLGRGKRQHVLYHRFQSDEEDDPQPRKYIKSKISLAHVFL